MLQNLISGLVSVVFFAVGAKSAQCFLPMVVDLVDLIEDGLGAIRVVWQYVQFQFQALFDLLKWSISEIHRICRLVLFLLDPVAEAQILCYGRLTRSTDHGCAALGP